MPTVSVIVPNYNHARFLRQRMESVLGQTYQDFEVILLDDCSTDDSRSILSSYAGDPRVRMEFNEVNSGSTFKQWNKGVRLARGEYVWIAESDDYADKRLLERLVSLLDSDTSSVLAYCRSWRILADGQIAGFVDSYYYAELDPQRWKTNFWADGAEECQNYLVRGNTIPNASAVLFRRKMYVQVGGADESLSLCGDWKLWAAMALTGKIAYSGEPLNYHRFHDTSVRKSKRGEIERVESLEVIHWILRRVTPSDAVRRKLCENAFSRWAPAADAMEEREPDAALRVIDDLLELSALGFAERSVHANTWLKAAAIHLRQGRRGKALAAAGRAVLVRPIIAGRPVKRAFEGLVAAFKNRR